MTIEAYVTTTVQFATIIPLIAIVVGVSGVFTTLIVRVVARLVKRTEYWATMIECKLMK